MIVYAIILNYLSLCLMSKALSGPLQEQFMIKRSTHGLGLFAKVPFKRGDFVIEYTGEKLTEAQSEARGGRYLMRLNKRYMIDGSDRKNAARYINHSCKPNCVPYVERGKVNIYATKRITPGDELTYNYGKEYVTEFIAPDGCCCAHCVC